MQYALFDELAAMMRMRELARVDLKRLDEIHDIETNMRRPSLRRSIASGLVALGVRLDEAAGERALAANGARASR